ncbi:MAG: serine hydrolase [Pseudomonadota bacterium]
MMKRRGLLASSAAFLAMPALAMTASLTEALEPLDQLHSLQVRQGDRVVFAEAPRGPGLEQAANIKSVSKSVVALLLGQAIEEGHLSSVRSTLGDVAPRLIPSRAEAGARDITLEDLVTLRAGLERTSGANYGGWVASSNWVANALARPLVAEPGGRFLYSTGSTHILGAALAEAVGESLLAQARRVLGRPMGFEVPAWTRDPQGYYLGGNEMALTPRAMLDLAVMVRDGGRFEGRQIVSQAWIEASLTPRARSPWSGLAYGYGWFLSPMGWALGRGYGGQIIAAHRARDLAVAITSDPTRPARSGGYFGDIMRLLDGPILAI